MEEVCKLVEKVSMGYIIYEDYCWPIVMVTIRE